MARFYRENEMRTRRTHSTNHARRLPLQILLAASATVCAAGGAGATDQEVPPHRR